MVQALITVHSLENSFLTEPQLILKVRSMFVLKITKYNTCKIEDWLKSVMTSVTACCKQLYSTVLNFVFI